MENVEHGSSESSISATSKLKAFFVGYSSTTLCEKNINVATIEIKKN